MSNDFSSRRVVYDQPRQKFAINFHLIEMQVVARKQTDTHKSRGDRNRGTESERIAVGTAERYIRFAAIDLHHRRFSHTGIYRQTCRTRRDAGVIEPVEYPDFLDPMNGSQIDHPPWAIFHGRMHAEHAVR